MRPLENEENHSLRWILNICANYYAPMKLDLKCRYAEVNGVATDRAKMMRSDCVAFMSFSCRSRLTFARNTKEFKRNKENNHTRRVQHSNELAINSNYDASEGSSPSSFFADSESCAEPNRMSDGKLAFDEGNQPGTMNVTAHSLCGMWFLTEWNMYWNDIINTDVLWNNVDQTFGNCTLLLETCIILFYSDTYLKSLYTSSDWHSYSESTPSSYHYSRDDKCSFCCMNYEHQSWFWT